MGSPAVGEVLTPAADGSRVAFNLAHAPTDPAQVAVYVGGVRVRSFTISGQQVTLAAAPPSGDTPMADYPYTDPPSVMNALTTLANVKEYLKLTLTDSDNLLNRLIVAQSRWLQSQIQRQIVRATYLWTFNGDDNAVASKPFLSPWLGGVLFGGFEIGSRGFAITLKEWPVLGINSVVVDGGDGTGALTPVPQATNLGQATQTDGWVLHDDSGKLELIGFRFTHGVNNCSVSYDAGYDTIPEDIEQAVIELVAWRFRERDSIRQVSKTVGGEVASLSQAAAPASVMMTIDAYRRVQA